MSSSLGVREALGGNQVDLVEMGKKFSPFSAFYKRVADLFSMD